MLTIISGVLLFMLALFTMPVLYYDDTKYKLERKGEAMKERIQKSGVALQIDTERAFVQKEKRDQPPDLEAAENDQIDGGSLGQSLSVYDNHRISRVQFKQAENKMKQEEMRIKTFMQVIEPEWPEETQENQGKIGEEKFIEIAKFAFCKMNQEEKFDE